VRPIVEMFTYSTGSTPNSKNRFRAVHNWEQYKISKIFVAKGIFVSRAVVGVQREMTVSFSSQNEVYEGPVQTSNFPCAEPNIGIKNM